MSISAPKDLAAWRNAALGSLSFAGLVLLSDSQSIISAADANRLYYAPSAPGWSILGYFVSCLIVLACCGFAVWSIWPRRFAAEGLAAVLYVLLILLPMLFQCPLGLFYIFWVRYRIAAFLFVALLYLFRKSWIQPLTSYVLLFGLGFLPVGIIPAIMSQTGPAHHSMSLRPLPAHAPDANAKRPERVVWIIFDEFDYRLAFESRPPGLHLPALDSLRSESLFLTDARPAGLWTLDVIPAYLTGKPLRGARPASPSSIELDPSPSGEPYPFDARRSLFGRLSSQGSRISLIGYYHPYTRLFSGLHMDTRWFHNVDASPVALDYEVFQRHGFLTGLKVQLLSHQAWFFGLPYSWGERITRAASQAKRSTAAASQAEGLASLMPSALDAATDPTRDVVYIHLPIPHPPGVANMLGEWVRQPKTGVAYLDNLLVVDGFTATLRQRLTAAGLWDRTNLIVTSDHPLRHSVWKDRADWIGDPALLGPSDRGRIPFFFKPAGGGPGGEITTPIPLLCLHDFVLATTRGEVRGLDQARVWMLDNAKKYPLRWPITTVGGLRFE